MASALIHQFDFNRQYLMNLLVNTTEDECRLIPNGFDTNILWNAGQIFTVMEESLFVFTRLNELPVGYSKLFSPQSRPCTWQNQDAEPPTLEILKAQIQDQTSRVKEIFGTRLEEPLVPPYKLHSGFELGTIGEVLGFANYHNAVRTGFIEALKQCINGLAK